MKITTTTEQILKDIAFALNRIAGALEETNKPKGLGNPNGLFGLIPCISKEEIPLPTPWNTDYKPTCNSDKLQNDLY